MSREKNSLTAITVILLITVIMKMSMSNSSTKTIIGLSSLYCTTKIKRRNTDLKIGYNVGRQLTLISGQNEWKPEIGRRANNEPKNDNKKR